MLEAKQGALLLTLMPGMQYNGCRWRGGVLKVDVAKPSYTARLQDIWEAVQEDEAEDAAVVADAEAGVFRHVLPARPNATIKLMRRDGRKVRLRHHNTCGPQQPLHPCLHHHNTCGPLPFALYPVCVTWLLCTFAQSHVFLEMAFD